MAAKFGVVNNSNLFAYFLSKLQIKRRIQMSLLKFILLFLFKELSLSVLKI